MHNSQVTPSLKAQDASDEISFELYSFSAQMAKIQDHHYLMSPHFELRKW